MVEGISGMSQPSIAMIQQMREQMFARTDQNGDGGIDKTELQQMIEQMPKHGGQAPDVEELFSAADTNGDGTLDATEFAAIGPPPPGDRFERSSESQDLEEMFAAADTNGDGVIDATEFAAMRPSQLPESENSGSTTATTSQQNNLIATLLQALGNQETAATIDYQA
ncbi:MAG: EF-hand domain-containing protein [bacterium]